MSIIFNHEIFNEFGVSCSFYEEEDPENENSILVTCTWVADQLNPYYIVFTDTYDDDGVTGYFMLYRNPMPFLANFFQSGRPLFKLAEDEYSRLEGRTLQFDVKYTD